MCDIIPGTQMWISVLRTTEDAVNMLPVPTYLTALTAPVIMDTPVMDLTAHVRYCLYTIADLFNL